MSRRLQVANRGSRPRNNGPSWTHAPSPLTRDSLTAGLAGMPVKDGSSQLNSPSMEKSCKIGTSRQFTLSAIDISSFGRCATRKVITYLNWPVEFFLAMRWRPASWAAIRTRIHASDNSSPATASPAGLKETVAGDPPKRHPRLPPASWVPPTPFKLQPG